MHFILRAECESYAETVAYRSDRAGMETDRDAVLKIFLLIERMILLVL